MNIKCFFVSLLAIIISPCLFNKKIIYYKVQNVVNNKFSLSFKFDSMQIIKIGEKLKIKKINKHRNIVINENVKIHSNGKSVVSGYKSKRIS